MDVFHSILLGISLIWLNVNYPNVNDSWHEFINDTKDIVQAEIRWSMLFSFDKVWASGKNGDLPLKLILFLIIFPMVALIPPAQRLQLKRRLVCRWNPYSALFQYWHSDFSWHREASHPFEIPCETKWNDLCLRPSYQGTKRFCHGDKEIC